MPLAVALSSSLVTSVVGRPSWLPANAAYYADFQSGNYWNGNATIADTFISTACTSTRYHPNSSGVYSAFSANTNAITDLGLLIEDEAENEAHYSQAIKVGTNEWGGNSVQDLNAATAPDGTMTASVFTTQEWIWQNVSGDNGLKCFSIFLRAADSTSFTTTLKIRDNDSDTDRGEQTINVTDEWQRFLVSGTTAGVTTGVRPIISNSGGGVNPPVGTEIWGAQVEHGVSVPSSYIPTTSTNVTRAAATFTIPTDGGTYDWEVTFDDDSTQSFNGVTGDLVRAGSALNGTVIKSVVGVGS